MGSTETKYLKDQHTIAMGRIGAGYCCAFFPFYCRTITKTSRDQNFHKEGFA